MLLVLPLLLLGSGRSIEWDGSFSASLLTHGYELLAGLLLKILAIVHSPIVRPALDEVLLPPGSVGVEHLLLAFYPVEARRLRYRHLVV